MKYIILVETKDIVKVNAPSEDIALATIQQNINPNAPIKLTVIDSVESD